MTATYGAMRQQGKTAREYPSGSHRLSSSEPGRAHRLEVRRQDIEFADVGPGVVEIAITVRNLGDRVSPIERGAIQAAPLGAFVPWQPLGAAVVPPLEPGQSVVLRTRVRRVMPEPMDDPDRIPPARILTAMGFDDEDRQSSDKPRSRNRHRPAVALPGVPRGPLPNVDDQSRLATLPANPLDLLARGNLYWAGNLNVFIGGQPVERHRASELRIVPERTNLVMFFVGNGHPDSYKFDLLGLDRRWEVALMNPVSHLSLSRIVSESQRIEPGCWIPIREARVLMMALRPPATCREAAVEVHVCQQSTQQTAVVEFTFDARAAGPGCYVIG